MIKTLKFTNYNYLSVVIIFFMLIFSCGLAKKDKFKQSLNVNINSNICIANLYNLIDEYDPNRHYLYYKEDRPYAVADSINSQFEWVYTKAPTLLMDSNFRKPLLFLLEKIFLYKYNYCKNKNAFYIYNTRTWQMGGMTCFIQFAVNAINNMPVDSNETYNRYMGKGNDVFCVDYVISEASKYHLSFGNHVRIHNQCTKLMPTSCIGDN